MVVKAHGKKHDTASGVQCEYSFIPSQSVEYSFIPSLSISLSLSVQCEYSFIPSLSLSLSLSLSPPHLEHLLEDGHIAALGSERADDLRLVLKRRAVGVHAPS